MISFLSRVDDQMRAMFPPETHPYRVLERAIAAHLHPGSAVLDIGCGRTAPNLTALIGKAESLTGIDLVDFADCDPRLKLFHNDVSAMKDIADASIDLAYSRAVMEHISEIEAAYAEISRVLRPGGVYIFITPSIYDYGSIIASIVPNRFHGRIVNVIEGRPEEDVFPTVYGSNSLGVIRRRAAAAGLHVRDGRYIGQYPGYLVFNRVLFWLGSMYQKAIEKFALTQPLQGWIFCILEKQAISDRAGGDCDQAV
jgi:SAM-dependent methyltransferase